MRKAFSCFVMLCIFFSTTLAQQTFEPGYILEHNRDTVKGYIENAMEYELTLSVKFRTDDKSPVKEYGPSDLAGFGIGKAVYENIRFQNELNKTQVNAFVKKLVTGEYDLFSYVTAERKFYLWFPSCTLKLTGGMKCSCNTRPLG